MGKFASFLNPKRNKGILYIILQLSAAVIFAILYLLIDLFVANYPTLAKKLNVHTNSQEKGEKFTPGQFSSYMYFSLITQTTVGYSDMLPPGAARGLLYGRGGDDFTPLYRILTICQLLSIIVIAGLTAAWPLR
jgi:hypothetical protein